MAKNILILTGSARPGSAGSNVAKLVAAEAGKRSGVDAEIVEVSELNLPFYNAATPPSSPDHELTVAEAKAWSEKVIAADAVVWVMPEYNNSISGIQKNAIDWLYNEWTDKPLAVVAYGWYEGANVLTAVKQLFNVIKADVRAEVGLGFTKQLSIDGTALEGSSEAEDRISDAIDKLVSEGAEAAEEMELSAATA